MQNIDYTPFMLQAIELSQQAFGRTAPNPCVGALLLHKGTVVAYGLHNAYGQPHAEREALAMAREQGVNIAECTLLVTLEPCNHHGKTPPCTNAILEAGIKQVVIGALDPNPVAAGGIKHLQEAGVKVITGVAEQACLDNIADFKLLKTSNRAHLILKLASTLDGRIATRSGHSQWVSCPQTLGRTHWLRSRVQAVMVGGATFYTDNPQLTARPEAMQPYIAEQNTTLHSAQPCTANSAFTLPASSNLSGIHKQPLAVIVSSRLPENYSQFTLLRNRPTDTIFFTTNAAANSHAANALRKIGVTVYGLAGNAGNLNLEEALVTLRQKHGCYHVLCEGGGKFGLSLIEQKLADRFDLHLAPKIVGDAEAPPLFAGRTPQTMNETINMRVAGTKMCGSDMVLSFMPL